MYNILSARSWAIMERSFLFILYITLSYIHAEIDTLWTRDYSIDDSCFAGTGDYDIVKLNSENFILLADFICDDGDSLSMVLGLLKIDISGNVIWSHRIDSTGVAYNSVNIEYTSDGGFIIGAKYIKNSVSRFCIIKTDSTGEQDWQSTFLWGSANELTSIGTAIDGGYTLTGYSYQSGNITGKFVKIDSLGNEMWEKDFSGVVTSQEETLSGSFILGLTLPSRVAMINEFGDSLWTKQYFDIGYPAFHMITIDDHGGYILVGNSDLPDGYGNNDIVILKIDSLGNDEWHMNYGTAQNDYGYSIINTVTEGYAIAGVLNNKAYVLLIDSLGNEEWSSTMANSNSFMYDIVESGVNKYITIGRNESLVPNAVSVWSIFSSCIGDLDNDGYITPEDVSVLMYSIMNGEDFMDNADMNYDTSMDIIDLLMLIDIENSNIDETCP